jgi:hypothetical protein
VRARARHSRRAAQPAAFDGFDELKPEDQATIEELCSGTLSPNKPAKKQRLDPAAAAADDPSAQHPGYQATLAKYSAMAVSELKEWLDVNEQPKGGACALRVAGLACGPPAG